MNRTTAMTKRPGQPAPNLNRTAVSTGPRPGSEALRKDIRPARISPFRSTRKEPGGTRCSSCGLVFRDGRWRRGRLSARARGHALCPACCRVRDGCPAGILRMGTLVSTLRSAVLRRIEHVAHRAEAEHPLQRIMRLEMVRGQVVVYATDAHLVARIGKALQHDLGGRLDLRYRDDEFLLARWSPPES